MAELWADRPWVHLTRRYCPDCGGFDHDVLRSDDAGEGARTQKCLCRSCGSKFKAAWEPPDPGDLSNPKCTLDANQSNNSREFE